MSIEFTCDGCGKRYRAPDSAAGRKTRCKVCGATVAIPAAAAGDLDPPPLDASPWGDEWAQGPVQPAPPPYAPEPATASAAPGGGLAARRADLPMRTKVAAGAGLVVAVLLVIVIAFPGAVGLGDDDEIRQTAPALSPPAPPAHAPDLVDLDDEAVLVRTWEAHFRMPRPGPSARRTILELRADRTAVWRVIEAGASVDGRPGTPAEKVAHGTWAPDPAGVVVRIERSGSVAATTTRGTRNASTARWTTSSPPATSSSGSPTWTPGASTLAGTRPAARWRCWSSSAPPRAASAPRSRSGPSST